jgi:hypothetical protein
LNWLLRAIRGAPTRLLVGRPSMDRVEFILGYTRNKEVLDLGIVQHSIEAYDSPTWLHRHIQREASYSLGLDILGEEVEVLREKTGPTNNRNPQSVILGELVGRALRRASRERGAYRRILHRHAWRAAPQARLRRRTCPIRERAGSSMGGPHHASPHSLSLHLGGGPAR